MGVGANAIQRKSVRDGEAVELERLKLFETQRAENARRILRRPEIVLDMLSSQMSVFDERNIAKVLHRYIDGAGTFRHRMARILQSPELLRIEFATGEDAGTLHHARAYPPRSPDGAAGYLAVGEDLGRCSREGAGERLLATTSCPLRRERRSRISRSRAPSPLSSAALAPASHIRRREVPAAEFDADLAPLKTVPPEDIAIALATSCLLV